VKINGDKESSQETSKEDRKEEISSPHMHTHFFWLEEKFSSLLFAVSTTIKLYSEEKFK